MVLHPVEKDQIAWADFLELTTAIRDLVLRLSGAWDARFKGTGASVAGVFEADYQEAEQAAQNRYLSALQRRGLTTAQTFFELVHDLNSQQARELHARMRVSAWNHRKGDYLEYLSLLATLSQYRPAARSSLVELSGPLAGLPIARISNGETHYLWTQVTVPAGLSGLNARPDLLIATQNTIGPSTVFTIRESKHTRLRANTIRSEFGKAFDLSVRSYVIVSYYDVSPQTCAAIRRLGLEVESLRLGQSERPDREPEALGTVLARAFDQADERSRFTETLATSADRSEAKEVAVRRPE